MRLSIRALAVTLLALIVSGCAVHRPHDEGLKPTYVLVLTIDAKWLSSLGDVHCAADCSTGAYDPTREPIFFVEDLGYGRSRDFTQIMISPRWHQPDLQVARQWGRCVVEALEKPSQGFDKMVVTSAYLIRVLGPADYIGKGASTLADKCELPRMRK